MSEYTNYEQQIAFTGRTYLVETLDNNFDVVDSFTAVLLEDHTPHSGWVDPEGPFHSVFDNERVIYDGHRMIRLGLLRLTDVTDDNQLGGGGGPIFGPPILIVS